MKKLIFNAAFLTAAVCLLPACSSEDDDEMLERQSQSGFPTLRKSAEAEPVLVCGGSATTTATIGPCNVKANASWSLYDAPPGSAVQPEGTLSIGAFPAGGGNQYTCIVEVKKSSLTKGSVSASGTIKVRDAFATPPKPGDSFGNNIPGELDYQIVGSASFSLTGGNGYGTLSVQ